MVGAVIVAGGRRVAEGFHKRFGGPHAEVEAISRAGDRAHGTTLYVTLEPCTHHGKTPPCVESIIAAGLARVVVATEDPNPVVRGKGIAALREAGIEVDLGECADEARFLNGGHFTFHELGRPLVSLKVAATLDGRIAAAGGRSKWITSEEARREVHRMRSEVDAVVVGRTTAQRDDPALTVRHCDGRNPARVVLDSGGATAHDCRLLRDGASRTVIVTRPGATAAGGEHWEIEADSDGRPNLDRFIKKCADEGWRHLLVEGGAGVATAFLRSGLVDRLYLFTAPKLMGGGGSLSWVGDLWITDPADAPGFRFREIRQLGPDVLCVLEADREALG